MSLPLPLGVAVEQGIETLLKLDPDTRDRLSGLDGKLIQVNVTSPPLSFALSITAGKVHVVGGLESPADTTLTGSLSALRSLSRSNDALYTHEVGIEGDIGTGQKLREVIAGLDPDWEELVSPLVGDSLAHRLGVIGKRLSGWLDRTGNVLRDNTGEYLQEELELLAPNSEVREYCREVDDVRAAVDRLDARVRKLERLSADRGERT